MKLLATLVLCCATAHAADLLVAAASDLAPIAPKLEKAYPEKIRFTLASSGSLKQQIENGAPFDVFLSANESYVRDLAAAGFVTDATVYAIGRLALWSPNGSVASLEDLKKPTVIHLSIPNPQHAPYGVAAKEALEARGLWKAVEPKIVYGENVRQALQFAESGNVEAVITSWTLLIGKGTLLPAEWHKPIRQTGAILKSSAQAEAARRFLKFLTGSEAQKTLNDNGLSPVH
ncbi:MAG TPA: molybdate ABC transporter substrate-binding protein [Bryobacteraceae bacterium]|nr:molybdate ABC transporter substrate-binding protein [Bryobacteraceae bacterium]